MASLSRRWTATAARTGWNCGGSTPKLLTGKSAAPNWKPSAAPAVTSKLDPTVVDQRHYKVEFENDQVRVLRVHYEAHDEGARHEHLLNRVVVYMNDQSGAKLKFLRRVPVDPMTNSTEWGLRAYQDKPGLTTWGRGNVFDVYSKSGATALDGTKYKDW